MAQRLDHCKVHYIHYLFLLEMGNSRIFSEIIPKAHNFVG